MIIDRPEGGRIVWLMLNPSNADEKRNDPTIRKVYGFSRLWGYGWFDVYNLFAYRTPHPNNLGKVEDAIGPDNYDYLKQIPYDTPLVAAWGHLTPRAKQRWSDWLETVRKMLTVRNTHRLGQCQTGDPRHPLMLKYSTPLERWNP